MPTYLGSRTIVVEEKDYLNLLGDHFSEIKNEKEVKKPKVKTAVKPVKKITKKKTVKAKKA